MDDNNPFGYPFKTYLWVLVVACVGGLVKHLNSTNKINLAKMCTDVITSGFTGIMTFWLCQSMNIHGPASAIMIATGGLMGNRAWREFENFWRLKMGIPAAPDANQPREQKPKARKKDEASE